MLHHPYVHERDAMYICCSRRTMALAFSPFRTAISLYGTGSLSYSVARLKGAKHISLDAYVVRYSFLGDVEIYQLIMLRCDHVVRCQHFSLFQFDKVAVRMEEAFDAPK